MKKIYISGAISGTDDYMDRFGDIQQRLHRLGFLAINPALICSNMPKGTTYEEYMKVCFTLLEMCDCVLFMKGWEQSKWARMELKKALELGLEIIEEK